MRGGRSNYEGCYPSNVRQDLNAVGAAAASAVSAVFTKQPSEPSVPTVSRAAPAAVALPCSPFSRTSSGGSLSSTCSSSNIRDNVQLADLLVAESLMQEDEVLPRCCESRLTDSDPDPFGSILHLTDHCLYRIVRWARNRPDFANVSVKCAFN